MTDIEEQTKKEEKKKTLFFKVPENYHTLLSRPYKLLPVIARADNPCDVK